MQGIPAAVCPWGGLARCDVLLESMKRRLQVEYSMQRAIPAFDGRAVVAGLHVVPVSVLPTRYTVWFCSEYAVVRTEETRNVSGTMGVDLNWCISTLT